MAYPVSFIEAATTEDEYGQSVSSWDSPTTIVRATAQVTFGTGREKREAAQESASQAATFECLRTPTLDAVPMTARIDFDGSQWDITERSPLNRTTIRFTAVRLVS